MKTIQSLMLSFWRQALSNEKICSMRISADDLAAQLNAVRDRAFQRLMQALLREKLLDVTLVETREEGAVIRLPDSTSEVQFHHLKSYRMGAWDVKGPVHLCSGEHERRELMFPSELLSCFSSLFGENMDEKSIERLSEELDDSFYGDTLCSVYHGKWNDCLEARVSASGHKSFLAWLHEERKDINPTCLLEQWGCLGHPWHPNYKSKQGMRVEDLINSSPEFDSTLAIEAFALDREHAHCESLPFDQDLMVSIRETFPESLLAWETWLRERGVDPDDYYFLPVHPFQSIVIKEKFKQEINDGVLIPTGQIAFVGKPGMSFRTLWSGPRDEHPLIKLPVALRLTSVQRTVTPRSARMGPRVSHLLDTIKQREPDIDEIWDFLPERYGLHFLARSEEDDRSRFLGFIWRDNPLQRIRNDEMAIPVGSLFALDGRDDPLLKQWIKLLHGNDSSSAARSFLLAYLSVAIKPMLHLYLVYGIAFEAHQQNSFMIIGDDFCPRRLLIRDFGDIRIYRPALESRGLHVEVHDPKLTLFDDPVVVREKLLHAFFMCHIGELVLLCERMFPGLTKTQVWRSIRKIIEQAFEDARDRTSPERWKTERHAVLEDDWPAKAFVRMRLKDTPYDIVGSLPNPLR